MHSEVSASGRKQTLPNDRNRPGADIEFPITGQVLPTIESSTMIKLALLSLLLTTSTAANAQYANVEGQFRSQATSLDLIALDSESGVIAATTTVVQGSCSGSVAGVGKVVKNVLTFSPYTKVEKDDACVITVTFDKQKKTAKVEGASCSMHSGAACGWEGDIVRRVKEGQSRK